MKKLLSLFLVIALALPMTTLFVFAAEENISGDKTTGNVSAQYVPGEHQTIYSIDITWGGMQFDYEAHEVWDHTSHQWIPHLPEWVSKDSSNIITLENNSSVAMAAAFSFTPENAYAHLSGCFSHGEKLLNGALVLPLAKENTAADRYDICFIPEGEAPSSLIHYTKIGMITVTLAEASYFDGGDGLTEQTAFLISSADQLYKMAEVVNNQNTEVIGKAADGVTDITYGTAYYKLTDDIVLNEESFSFDDATGLVKIQNGTSVTYLGTGIVGQEATGPFGTTASAKGTFYTYENDTYTETIYDGELKEWTPIGIDGAEFKGRFDGNNKTISGLFINKADSSNLGLFGVLDENIQGETTVKNVNLAGALIVGADSLGLIGSLPATVSDPVIPTTPVDPVVPTTPVDPVVPTTPVDPVVPTTPVDPVVPTTPVDPVVPTTPEDSVVPTTPEDPVVPVTPEDPVVPTTPPDAAAFALTTVSLAEITVKGCSMDGIIIGDHHVGGIVGSISYFTETILIQSCTNRAIVRAANTSSFAGGIVGACYSSTPAYLQDCTNYGSIGQGAYYCGAIAGQISADYVESCRYLSGSAPYGLGHSSYGEPVEDLAGQFEAFTEA